MTEEGQAILVGKLNDEAGPRTGLYPSGYTAESKAMLYAAGEASDGEWIEVELCADTGACNTVILRKFCELIPIQSLLQSFMCVEYDVVDGHTILNLGDRRCIMTTHTNTLSRHPSEGHPVPPPPLGARRRRSCGSCAASGGSCRRRRATRPTSRARRSPSAARR